MHFLQVYVGAPVHRPNMQTSSCDASRFGALFSGWFLVCLGISLHRALLSTEAWLIPPAKGDPESSWDSFPRPAHCRLFFRKGNGPEAA